MAKKDWAGLKFDVLEELGDSMTFIFVKRSLEPEAAAAPYEFHFFRHREFDGVGAFTYLLEQEGLDPGPQPTVRDSKPPPWHAYFRIMRRIHLLNERVETRWRQELQGYGNPEAFAFFTFTQAQTEAIRQAARTRGIASTPLLLRTLDEAAAARLTVRPCPRKWLSPINMRGGVVAEKAYGNFSSGIIFNLEDEASFEQVHADMKQFLEQRLHWGSWIVANLVFFIGKRGLRRLIQKGKGEGFGMFSNLGAWPPPHAPLGEPPRDRYAWSIVAPASRLFPVSATSLTWDDRLTLNLQLHPSLGIGRPTADRILQDWASGVAQFGGLDEQDLDWPNQMATIPHAEAEPLAIRHTFPATPGQR